MSFSEVFGGATLYASQQTYLAISFGVDITLTWPIEQQIAGTDVVSDIMDLTATAVSLNVDLPDARQVSNGIQSVFTNQGANTFTIRDNVGGTIISIAPGEAWVAYLTDNSTQAGTWRTFQLGATVSVSNAAALAGAGLKAIATTLNQRIEVDTEAATPFSVVDADRAQLKNYTGGVGVANLPDPATVGADWWFLLRNSGAGDLTVTPAAGQIDAAATVDFSPGESGIIVTDGSNYFTVGFGTGSTSVFDFISIAVPGTGDFTLSGAQLDRISYRFTGILTGNRQIVVPGTVQQYWVDNQTTGAFALSVGTVAQVTPPEVPQGERAILYSDGTDVVNATTSSITFPITIAQGGTGAITAGAALTNLGAVPTSRALAGGTGISATGLGDLSADRTINAEVASETVQGVAELATQAEVNTGTDDTRIITPLKLADALNIPRIVAISSAFAFTNQGGFVDITGLTFDIVNGETYILQGAFAAATTTGGMEFQVEFTGNQTSTGNTWVATSGSGEARTDFLTFNNSEVLFTIASGSSQSRSCRFQAGVVATANGTINLRARQTLADANTSDVDGGAWMSLARIA